MNPEGSSKLTNETIQQAYVNAVKQNILHEVLNNIFQSIKSSKAPNRSSLINQ